MRLREASQKYHNLYMEPGLFTDRTIALSDASIILENSSNKTEARKRLRTGMYERGGSEERKTVFREALGDIAPRPKI